jgi:polar amino acid transport system substrate-binding protein
VPLTRPLVGLLALSTLLLTACGPQFERPRQETGVIAPAPGLAQPGFLTVAVPSDLPPYAFRRGTGSSQGFAVDLAREMANRMSVQLNVVALDPQDLPAAARGGEVDVVLGTLPVPGPTIPAPPDLLLQPYLRSGTQLMIRADSQYQPHQLIELCGHAAAFIAGSAQEAVLAQATALCGQAGAPQPVATRTDTEALTALRGHQAGVYLADQGTTSYDTANQADLTTTTDQPLDSEQLCMGMRTGGAALTDTIIRDFYLVHSDGTYEILLQKWGMTAQLL